MVLIRGGLEVDVDAASPTPTAAQVREEAARRVKVIGYEEWRVREFMTGRPMPASVKYLQLQIGYAAAALARLPRIPDDFRNDAYWPGGDDVSG